jgi:AcrR family transcriptional regulator
VHLLRRRERIVATAFELLASHEYDEIQVKQIAETSGVALGTIYRYFTSKEHLYAAALLQWSSRFDPASEDLIPGEDDEQRIRHLLGRAVRALRRRPQVLRAQLAISGSKDPNARLLFEEFSKRHLDVLLRALRDVETAEAPVVVSTLTAVFDVSTRAWGAGQCSINEVQRTLDRSVTLIFHGVTDRQRSPADTRGTAR